MVFSLRFRRGKVVEDPFVPNEIGDEKKLVRYQSHIQSPTLDDRVRLVLLTGLSLYARIVQLGYPAYITEIELEMSKQVNWYMAGKYFIGKFPPLSSLINTCLALFVGYYGNHDFVYAGQHFSNFPLVGMRKVSAIFGALIAPVCYMTIRNFGHSRSAATFAAILLVFENGIITQSRYASPEIHSMFFGVLATWSWSMARKNTSGSISNGLYWQVITGLCIGLSTSAKWTGALLLPIIWCSIAFEMWNQLSDKKNSVYSCIKKVYVYLFTVGAFPFWIYMLIFKIHFDIASNAGDHDLILSSRFRYSLNGNHFEPSQPSIAYGSQVVIKHEGSPGGFLHSHQKRFTGGSTQQEVTLYPYVDLNNIWTIHKATELYNTSQPLEYVRNGDHIRLEHFPSSRKLHSHDERPQLTNKKEHHEVTAYGDRLTSDIQDYWSLVLLDDKHEHSKDMNVTWKALDQQFRLFHIRGCALISHDAYYDSPGGHGHQEVTCMVSAGKHVSTWTIESAYHEKLENTGLRSFPKMKFYEKFKEAHQLMLKYPTVVFDRLGSQTTSTDGTINPKVTFVETPSKWFFKKTSLRIWYELSGFSVHLLLNSAVQQIIWSAMLGYMGIRFLKMFLEKRQINLPGLSWINMAATDLMTNDTISFFYPATLIYIQGLHFIPTHTVNMSDILPSIYYGIALSSVIFESLTSRLSLRYRRMVSYSLISIVIFHTLQFSHLSYGGKQWLRSSCEKSGIEMNCIHFPLSQNELDEMINNSGQTPNVTSLTIYLDIFGKKEPFRYQQGQEAEADRELSLLKHSAYSKASALITGTSRYHRANPTPAITIEEAVEWAKKVHEGAVDREKKLSKERAKKKALKKRRKKNALKKRKRLTDKEAEQSK